MSAEGIRSAQWIGRVQPQKAAILAAELRNAVTPAHSVLQEMYDCGHGGVEPQDHLDRLASLADTIAHVLRIADALQGPRPELPTVPEVGG